MNDQAIEARRRPLSGALDLIWSSSRKTSLGLTCEIKVLKSETNLQAANAMSAWKHPVQPEAVSYLSGSLAKILSALCRVSCAIKL